MQQDFPGILDVRNPNGQTEARFAYHLPLPNANFSTAGSLSNPDLEVATGTSAVAPHRACEEPRHGAEAAEGTRAGAAATTIAMLLGNAEESTGSPPHTNQQKPSRGRSGYSF